MNEFADYRDYLRPKGLVWIKTTLRVTVAVQCLGAAAQRLSGGALSPVADFLINDLDWAEAQAVQLDDAIAYGLIVCGILTAIRSTWLLLVPVMIWFLASALVPVVREGNPSSLIMLIEQAVRYLAPLALLILDFWPPRMKSHLGRTVIAMWILRGAVAATYTGIGLLAVLHSVTSGPSLSLLQAMAEQLGVDDLTDVAARCCLGAVGGLSIALALNILVTRSKPMLIASAVWGLVSAFSRMVELGPVGYPETLVRFAEIGAPVVVFLYLSLSIREFPPEIIPDN